MRKVSVRSIAARLEISASTVARALSGSLPVAESTRRLVLETAREMGYRRPGGHRRFLLICADEFCRASYDRSLIGEVIEQCARAKAGLMLITEANLGELSDTPFDGLFSVCYSDRINRFLAESFNCPVVCFNNTQCHRENIYSVNSDEAGAISAAVACFRAAGHRRIGLLGLDSRDFSHRRRREQFLAAVRIHPEMTGFLYEVSRQTDYWEILRALDRDATTAVLLPHEGFELSLLKILEVEGKRIPRDLSLITWEDPKVSQFVHPPLTTFSQDFATMAQRGVELMTALLHATRQHPARDVSVPYLFFERESVGAPPERAER